MKRRVQSKGEALRVLRLLVIKAVLCSCACWSKLILQKWAMVIN